MSRNQLRSLGPALVTAVEEIGTQQRFSAKQLAEFRARGEDLDLGFLDQPKLWLANSKASINIASRIAASWVLPRARHKVRSTRVVAPI